MSETLEPKPENLNPYLRTKVMTASPAELRMLLIDGALKFARQGRDGLEAKDYEQAYNGTSQCQAIVVEMINALNDDADPDLCENLRSLYVFMYTRLVSGLTEKNVEIMDEVIRLLEYERSTWSMVMEQLGAGGVLEHAAPGPNPADLAAVKRPAGHTHQRGAAPDLIGGSLSVEG